MKLNVPYYTLKRDMFAEKEWIFEESAEAYQATEKFDAILDTGRFGGGKSIAPSLRNFLKRFPWHFDAFTHYGLCKMDEGKTLDAYAFFQTAVALAQSCFPREFDPDNHSICGGFVQNRPYLRALSNLMNCCGVLGYVERAKEVGYQLLALDSNDRMAARMELPKYLLALKRYDAAVKLFETKRYHDTFHTALYLYPLALLQSGKKPEAIAAIKHLGYPKIAHYILNPELPMPQSDSNFGFTYGSPAEGFYYAQQYASYWVKCPGALGLLREAQTAR